MFTSLRILWIDVCVRRSHIFPGRRFETTKKKEQINKTRKNTYFFNNGAF